MRFIYFPFLATHGPITRLYRCITPSYYRFLTSWTTKKNLFFLKIQRWTLLRRESSKGCLQKLSQLSVSGRRIMSKSALPRVNQLIAIRQSRRKSTFTFRFVRFARSLSVNETLFLDLQIIMFREWGMSAAKGYGLTSPRYHRGNT